MKLIVNRWCILSLPEYHQLVNALAVESARVANLDETVDSLSTTIEMRDNTIAERDAAIADRDEAYVDLEEANARYGQLLNEQRGEIEMLRERVNFYKQVAEAGLNRNPDAAPAPIDEPVPVPPAKSRGRKALPK